MSRFYNPDIDLTGHNDYRYVFDSDALNHLHGAEYRYGRPIQGTASTSLGVNGLSYDTNSNILSLQFHNDTGILLDNMCYSYGSNN